MKAWITDRWVKKATARAKDGSIVKVAASPAQLRNINTLPEPFRSDRYGQGKRWQVTWRENGRLRRTSYATKTEAQAHLAELEDDLRTGKYTPPELAAQPFHRVAELWLETKINVKPATLNRYRTELRLYVLPRWGNTPINQITRQQLQTWVHELSTGKHAYGGDGKPNPLAPSMIKHVHSRTLAGVLRLAVREGWIKTNPTEHVNTPKTAEINELPILTWQEVENLAKAAATHGTQLDRLLILTLATCGMRINEAFALQKRDINLETRRIHITKTWTRGDRHAMILGSPKSGKPRQVPIPGYLADEFLVHFLTLAETDWVFHAKSSKQTPTRLSNWSKRVFRPALTTAHIDPSKGITPHKLRHTAASHAIAAGASVKLIQQMLGHARATETLDIYGHLFPDMLDTVMNNVAAKRAHELGL